MAAENNFNKQKIAELAVVRYLKLS